MHRVSRWGEALGTAARGGYSVHVVISTRSALATLAGFSLGLEAEGVEHRLTGDTDKPTDSDGSDLASMYGVIHGVPADSDEGGVLIDAEGCWLWHVSVLSCGS